MVAEMSLPIEEIAMVVVIIVAVLMVFVELQLRKIVKEEKGFDERLRKDETVLYNAEKVLYGQIQEMKKALQQWRKIEQ